MALMSLRVQINGTVHTLAIKPIDRVKFERESGTGVMQAFSESKISEEATMKLAWVAARRIGVVEPSTPFDAFLETLDDIEDDETPEVSPAVPLETSAAASSQ